MGRKIKTDIDWSLDKGNKVGDVVVLAQHAQTKLGVVSFLGQAPVYDYYANLVKEAYAKSQKLHERVLELPILSGPNLRYLQDPARKDQG